MNLNWACERDTVALMCGEVLLSSVGKIMAGGRFGLVLYFVQRQNSC